jgi:hypothetical protein
MSNKERQVVNIYYATVTAYSFLTLLQYFVLHLEQRCITT